MAVKNITDEQLQQAYQNVVLSDTGELVLNDLRYRCFKYTTTAGLTRDHLLLNEGKRQSLLHIESQLKPTTKE